MSLSGDEIEAKVAADVRAFRDARASGDAAATDERRRWPAVGLARLLDSCLRSDTTRDWQYEWIDDLIDESVAVTPDGLDVFALAIWGVEGTNQWIAPFEASLRREDRGGGSCAH